MITRVCLEHYRSISRADVNLGNVAILVGPNASGKSNFVDAIRFIRDAVRYDLDRAVSVRHDIESIREWSPFKPFRTTIKLHLQEGSGEGYYQVQLGSVKRQYRILKEEGSWRQIVRNQEMSVKFNRDSSGEVRVSPIQSTPQNKSMIFMIDKDELFVSAARVFPGPEFFTSIRSLARALTSFSAYSIYPNTLRIPQSHSNERVLSETGDNLTSVFKIMSTNKRGVSAREEIISSLRYVMPDLENVTIQSVGGLMVPNFRVKHRRGGRSHDLNVSQVSDGTLRLLGLLTALYQTYPLTCVALEEPEQTVHPGSLLVIAEAIKDVSDEKQVIVTTHSPNFIDLFGPESIISVQMDDSVTKIGPVRKQQIDAVRKGLFRLGELMTIEGFD